MNSVPDEISDVTSSVVYSAGTDVGMRREENQDSYGILIGDGYRLFCVADGMGGVQGGSVASNLALASIEKSLRDQADVTISQIVDAIKEANKQIHLRGNSDPSLNGMGTTIVGLLLSRKGAYSIHVGDSRAYQISGNTIKRLTEDHTLVQELVRSGAITEEQAEHHPVAHMLTRSLGPAPSVEVEFKQLNDGVLPNDKFLLCSDGLYNLVSEAEIAELVNKHSTDDATQFLIDLANERGGSDNITIIIVDSQKYSTPSVKSQPISDDKVSIQAQANINITDVVQSETVSSAVNNNLVGGYHSSGMINEPEKLQETVQQIQSSYESIEEEDTAPIPPVAEQIDELDLNTPVNARPFASKLVLILGSFFGGLLVSYLLFSKSSIEPDTEITAINSKANSQITLQEVEPSKESNKEPVVYNEVARIGQAERSAMQKRKSDLEIQIKDASTKINLLTASSSSQIESLEAELKKRAEENKSRINQLRSDIDVATRKLATWYDRKQRLDSVDVVNMASELAVSVPQIKQKKDEFEKATWDYLKAVESLPYATDASQREEKMQVLVRNRSAKMKELGDAVRVLIWDSLEDADDAVAMLTLQLSSLERELETIKQELEFIRTAISAEPSQKEKLVDNYRAKSLAATVELSELNKLLAN